MLTGDGSARRLLASRSETNGRCLVTTTVWQTTDGEFVAELVAEDINHVPPLQQRYERVHAPSIGELGRALRIACGSQFGGAPLALVASSAEAAVAGARERLSAA